jgi:hypothetical protein
VTTFSRLGFIKCLTSGTIRLTPKGETAAEEWLERSATDPATLSRRLPRKYRLNAVPAPRQGRTGNG